MKPVVNIHEVERTQISHGARYAESYAQLSDKVGAKLLGYNITTVPPGKRSCPFHNHHANEEMFLILAGEGTYRYGAGRYAVKPGDILAAPPGGPETAHHLLNTGDAPLTYLAVSTKHGLDLCDYPDSGKFQVILRAEDGHSAAFRHIGRSKDSLDYFDGEE